MARTGRKRKPVSREPNGRAQRDADYANQEREKNQSVVVDARARHFRISKEQAKDASWGHTIGVLKNMNIISEKQAKAADKHLMDVVRYHKMKGFPAPNPEVAAYAEMIPGTIWGGEPDDDEIRRMEARVDGARQFLIDNLGWKECGNCMPAFKRYIIGQDDGWFCDESEGAALRTVLNQLVRFYGV